MLEIEKFIPRENFHIGLLFNEGYFFFKILRKQQLTVFKPFNFDSNVAIQVNATSGWEAPADALGRFYLEPQSEEYIYQFFTGITPSQAKMYLDYEQRDDRMNLITPRLVPGQVGFWDGEQSPYNDPGPLTELWTVKNIYPYFNVENPGITNEGTVISASFWISIFTYQVVEDKNKILSFLRGDKRCTIRTMGDGSKPIKAPAWLLREYRAFMVCPEEV